MALYDPQTTSTFSITVQLGKDNKDVTIQAGDISTVATKGIHFALPDGTVVTLGTLTEFISWVNQKLSMSIPTVAGTDWPDTLKSVYNGVTGMTVTVTAFKIDQDGQDADKQYPPMDVQLAVTATAASPIVLIKDLFSVSGAGVGVIRSHTVKPK
jgi:hypothetical protein